MSGTYSLEALLAMILIEQKIQTDMMAVYLEMDMDLETERQDYADSLGVSELIVINE